MQIQQLTIKNFKKFRECRIEFDPHFNLLVGDNATGKTSVLDALTIAIDAWFLGMRTAEKAGGIDGDDVHLAPIHHPDSTTFEKQFPARIEAKGLVQGKSIEWSRELLREGGKTTTGRTKEIASLAEQADHAVRDGKEVVLPLICSYGAERLWFEYFHRDQPKKKDDSTPRRPSRFDGYLDCTGFNIQESDLIAWMKAEFLASRQRGASTIAWSAIKGAVLACVEYTTDLFFDDRLNEFVVRMEGLGDQRTGAQAGAELLGAGGVGKVVDGDTVAGFGEGGGHGRAQAARGSGNKCGARRAVHADKDTRAYSRPSIADTLA